MVPEVSDDGIGAVVIVGASVAGLSAADTLREEGFTGTLTILSAESVLPYDRPPLSKQALDPRRPTREYLLRPDSHYADHAIDLRLDSAALSVDTARKLVHTSEGEVRFGTLVIATGSRARGLHTTKGSPVPHVRTSVDCRRVREQAQSASSAVVIGTGFIGLEVASTLRQAGLDVTAVGFENLPLDRNVGPEIAQVVRDLHVEHGVRMIGGHPVVAVDETANGHRVHLGDGTVIQADMVLAGIGAHPNVEWLEGSGVVVDDGIPVDGWGRTNIASVYAAGDVAAFDNPLAGGRVRIEHWTSAVDQGRHVARAILGIAESPFAAAPYFWTDQYDCKFQTYGRRRIDDTLHVVEGSIADRSFVAVHGGHDGRYTAVTACGRPASLRPYRALLESSATLEQALACAGVSV